MSLISVVGVALALLPGGTATDDRVDAIWSYVESRMDQQTDIWFDRGDYPKVIQLLTFRVAVAPNDYDIVTNLGWMQENVEDYPAAIQTYLRYQKENPNDVDAGLPLATHYLNKRKFDLIPPLLEPAIKRTPHPHPNVYRVLARSYEKINRISDCIRVWNTYIAIAPTDLSAKANLKRVQEKFGKTK